MIYNKVLYKVLFDRNGVPRTQIKESEPLQNELKILKHLNT